MSERFDQFAKRLAALDDQDEATKGTSRRSFIGRAARTVAVLGSGLVAASPQANRAIARQCTPSKSEYRIAEEDGFVEDALGGHFVRKGEFIVLESSEDAVCSGGEGGVGTNNTAAQCGITSFNPGFSTTYLHADWTYLNCRACPWTSSTIQAGLYAGDPIGVSYASAQGETICYACWADASSVWYRTSGPIGCWFWSGGTIHQNWNIPECPYGC